MEGPHPAELREVRQSFDKAQVEGLGSHEEAIRDEAKGRCRLCPTASTLKQRILFLLVHCHFGVLLEAQPRVLQHISGPHGLLPQNHSPPHMSRDSRTPPLKKDMGVNIILLLPAVILLRHTKREVTAAAR